MQARTWIFTLGNTIALIAVLVVNFLAVQLPINGRTTGELSALYPNLFVPAGFTFSIWGIIYLSLLLWIVYQWWLTISKRSSKLLGQRLVGAWFWINSALNVAWIFAWHYEYPSIALVIMLGLLLSLIQIYRNLGIGLRETSHTERFFMHLPFSLYLGWISVATIANATAVLVYYNFSGWGLPEEFYASIMLIVASILAYFFLNYNIDLFYTLVIIWASFGIFYKHYYVLDTGAPIVYITAMAVIIFLGAKYLSLRRKFPKTRAYW